MPIKEREKQVKGALAIEPAKITTIIFIFESKKQGGYSKQKNKRRRKKCYVLVKKRHVKGEKNDAPVDFENILENQTVQRVGKFIMSDFYEMDFMKCIQSNLLKRAPL